MKSWGSVVGWKRSLHSVSVMNICWIHKWRTKEMFTFIYGINSYQTPSVCQPLLQMLKISHQVEQAFLTCKFCDLIWKKGDKLFFVWLCCIVPLIALGRDSPTNRWRWDTREIHLEYLYPETLPHFSRRYYRAHNQGLYYFMSVWEASIPLARGLKQQDKCHYILCLYKYQTYSQWPSQKFVFHREIDKGWISCLKFKIRTSRSSVVLWEAVWWRHP